MPRISSRLSTRLSTETGWRTAALALGADVLCVLAFIALGRRNHAEGVSLAGVAETAWPFLAGTGVGWLASRGWRRPAAVIPTGVTVWLCTVAVGMLLRRLTGEGTALSFIAVATAFTAVLQVGWRAIRALRSQRRR